MVTRATIANWESGRKEGVDIQELAALAKALDVPALSLLYPLDGMTPEEAQEAIDFSGYDTAYCVLYRWSDVQLLASLSPTPPNLASELRQVITDAAREELGHPVSRQQLPPQIKKIGSRIARNFHIAV